VRLFLFLGGSIVIAVALPYLLCLDAMRGNRKAIRVQQAIDAFTAGQPLTINYDRLSLSIMALGTGLIGSAPLIILATKHGMELSNWMARPESFFLLLVPLLFLGPTWNSLKRLLSRGPALVLSTDTLKIVERKTEIAWTEIASLEVWYSRRTYMTLRFHERTFCNSFFIRSRRLTLRADNYRDTNILIACLRKKTLPFQPFQRKS